MTEAELIEMIITKRNELEENRSVNVSNSLLKLQEEVLEELEYVYAIGEAERLDLRPFMDQCAE